jgi:hypothetical protein
MSGTPDATPGRDATVSKTYATVVSLVAVVVLSVAFTVVHALLWGLSDRDGAFWLTWVAILFVGILAHEGVHAVGFRLFGGVPWSSISFGVIWKALTPYAHTSTAMPAGGYRQAVLLPGLVTGLVPALIGLAVGSDVLSLAGAVLLGSAGGDWTVWQAIRSVPSSTLVADHPTDIGAVVLDREAARA